MFHSCEKSLSRQNPALPFEKCPALVHPGNAIMLQHLIIQFLLYYLSSRRLRKVKNKRTFQTSGSKSGRSSLEVLERYSLTRGSKYSDLTWKLLVFWKTGHWEEVFAYKRWSQPKVWLVVRFFLAERLRKSKKKTSSSLVRNQIKSKLKLLYLAFGSILMSQALSGHLLGDNGNSVNQAQNANNLTLDGN